MTIYNPEGKHEKYTATDRHFSPVSEQYTGADSLITAQRNGWQLMAMAYEQKIEMHGGRYTSLYYFKLVRDSEMMTMPILRTPFIERMIARKRVRIVAHPQQTATHKTDTTLEDTQIPVEKAAQR